MAAAAELVPFGQVQETVFQVQGGLVLSAAAAVVVGTTVRLVTADLQQQPAVAEVT